jgi:hypothetical protein
MAKTSYVGSGEPAAPRGQSLLRSFLAARSFPPRPPREGAIRQPNSVDSAPAPGI